MGAPPHRGAIQLRPDQDAFLARIYASIRQGARAILAQQQTSWGKGHAMTAMLADCANGTRKRGVVVTHLSEINRDLIGRIRQAGIEPRVLMGDHPEGPADSLVWVVSEQTVKRRGITIPDVRLCLRDEAHRQQSASALEVAAACLPRPGEEVVHVGFTATPLRGDKQPLKYYKVLLVGAQMRELVAAGIVAPMRAFSPERTGKGLAQDPVKIWPTYPDGAPYPGTLFAHNVGHSIELAQRFKAERGFFAAHCDKDTKNRAELIERFNEGGSEAPAILCNWRLLQEGADLRRSRVTMAATEIGHVGIQQQMCGRSRRLYPNPDGSPKEAYFWDLCNNIARLGHHPEGDLLYALDPEGALTVTTEGPAPGAIPQRCCPECWAWQRSGPPRCIYCLAPVPPPPMPKVSERAMREARLEQMHARQKLEGPAYEEWRSHVLAGLAREKPHGKITGAWAYAKKPFRYTIEQVITEELRQGRTVPGLRAAEEQRA